MLPNKTWRSIKNNDFRIIVNWGDEKSAKMDEIEKSKIQVSIKVGYQLYVPGVSDLGNDIFFSAAVIIVIGISYTVQPSYQQ